MAERTDPIQKTNHPFFCQYRAVYEYAKTFVDGKQVLDAGCGEGYGAKLLAESASEVIAIDRDKKTICQARQRYPQSNLQFHIRDINQLSAYPSCTFDVICCFHTIEHLKEPVQFLQEVRKLLSDSGLLLISTPNRKKTFVDWPYHEQEYTAEEFRTLLSTSFQDVALYALQASQNMQQFRELQAQIVQRIFRWDILQLHRWLPKKALQICFDIGGWSLKTYLGTAHKDHLFSIGSEDFHITSDKLDDGLDIIGVCKDERNRV